MAGKENGRNEMTITTSNGFPKHKSTFDVGYPFNDVFLYPIKYLPVPSDVTTRSDEPGMLYIYKAAEKEHIAEIESAPQKRKYDFPVTICNKVMKTNEHAKEICLKSVAAAKKEENNEDDDVIFVEEILKKDKPPLDTITLS